MKKIYYFGLILLGFISCSKEYISQNEDIVEEQHLNVLKSFYLEPGIAGDFDGDGKVDMGRFRRYYYYGRFEIDYAENGFGNMDAQIDDPNWWYFSFGVNIMSGDFDGDGIDDIFFGDNVGYSIDYAKNGFGNGRDVFIIFTDPMANGINSYYILGDFDGDRKADVSMNYAGWTIDYAENGFGKWDITYSGYGGSSTTAVPRDYDGDGKTDLSVKTDDGRWLIDYYAKNGFGSWDNTYSGYGGTSAIPIPADYDGDGKTDLSVKTDDGRWLIDYAKDGFGKWNVTYNGYGNNVDARPCPRDYDGDGKADLSVRRISNGAWLIDYSKNGFGIWDETISY